MMQNIGIINIIHGFMFFFICSHIAHMYMELLCIGMFGPFNDYVLQFAK